MFTVLFFFLDEKEKIPKEKITSYVSGAAPTLPLADGAITRAMRSNSRPLPALDSACAYAPPPMLGCAITLYNEAA